MAIEDFFDHRCSIYHTQQESTSPGYGLPGSPKFKYPKQPDLEEVPVALLAEGVDRNNRCQTQLAFNRASPSSRRAWIEIRLSMLHEMNLPCRPPRGGRG